MANKTEHICVKSDRITRLESNHTSMAENINDIKTKISNIDTKIDKIIEFVLTSPEKFADKDKTEKALNGINIKLAFASGIITIVTWVGIFIANKLF